MTIFSKGGFVQNSTESFRGKKGLHLCDHLFSDKEKKKIT